MKPAKYLHSLFRLFYHGLRRELKVGPIMYVEQQLYFSTGEWPRYKV